MGPPNRNGRVALLAKLLTGKPVADDVEVSVLADLTKGRSGAEIEHLVNEAGLLAIKEAIAGNISPTEIRMSIRYFQQVADGSFRNAATKCPSVVSPSSGNDDGSS
jgi:SpoVK/Ycf46/Vps4 family AAA+-type ATPase